MRKTVVALGFLVLVAVSGCDAASEASNAVSGAVDKGSVCVDALKLAGFEPDLSNPEKAAEEAKKRSEELGNLAQKTADTTVKDALNDMATKVGEFKPSNAVQWSKDKVERLDTLRRACI
ncbi:bacteriophage spanin2 family protein [Herbihabitans rhizosphaerae]|nr:bacteriophage spanin2 family protein [Herbihabitans rhizosphaerae]